MYGKRMQRPRAPRLGRPHWRPGTTAPSRLAMEAEEISRVHDRFGYCCGASRPGKVGMPRCRRPAREGDDDSLLKQDHGSA